LNTGRYTFCISPHTGWFTGRTHVTFGTWVATRFFPVFTLRFTPRGRTHTPRTHFRARYPLSLPLHGSLLHAALDTAGRLRHIHFTVAGLPSFPTRFSVCLHVAGHHLGLRCRLWLRVYHTRTVLVHVHVSRRFTLVTHYFTLHVISPVCLRLFGLRSDVTYVTTSPLGFVLTFITVYHTSLRWIQTTPRWFGRCPVPTFSVCPVYVLTLPSPSRTLSFLVYHHTPTAYCGLPVHTVPFPIHMPHTYLYTTGFRLRLFCIHTGLDIHTFGSTPHPYTHLPYSCTFCILLDVLPLPSCTPPILPTCTVRLRVVYGYYALTRLHTFTFRCFGCVPLYAHHTFGPTPWFSRFTTVARLHVYVERSGCAVSAVYHFGLHLRCWAFARFGPHGCRLRTRFLYTCAWFTPTRTFHIPFSHTFLHTRATVPYPFIFTHSHGLPHFNLTTTTFTFSRTRVFYLPLLFFAALHTTLDVRFTHSHISTHIHLACLVYHTLHCLALPSHAHLHIRFRMPTPHGSGSRFGHHHLRARFYLCTPFPGHFTLGSPHTTTPRLPFGYTRFFSHGSTHCGCAFGLPLPVSLQPPHAPWTLLPSHVYARFALVRLHLPVRLPLPVAHWDISFHCATRLVLICSWFPSCPFPWTHTPHHSWPWTPQPRSHTWLPTRSGSTGHHTTRLFSHTTLLPARFFLIYVLAFTPLVHCYLPRVYHGTHHYCHHCTH